jgi:hypothetical protein
LLSDQNRRAKSVNNAPSGTGRVLRRYGPHLTQSPGQECLMPSSYLGVRVCEAWPSVAQVWWLSAKANMATLATRSSGWRHSNDNAIDRNGNGLGAVTEGTNRPEIVNRRSSLASKWFTSRQDRTRFGQTRCSESNERQVQRGEVSFAWSQCGRCGRLDESLSWTDSWVFHQASGGESVEMSSLFVYVLTDGGRGGCYESPTWCSVDSGDDGDSCGSR